MSLTPIHQRAEYACTCNKCEKAIQRILKFGGTMGPRQTKTQVAQRVAPPFQIHGRSRIFTYHMPRSPIMPVDLVLLRGESQNCYCPFQGGQCKSGSTLSQIYKLNQILMCNKDDDVHQTPNIDFCILGIMWHP